MSRDCRGVISLWAVSVWFNRLYTLQYTQIMHSHHAVRRANLHHLYSTKAADGQF